MTDSFTQELSRWGPDPGYPSISLAQAQKYCADLARRHYENFTVASLLLPRQLRPHFHAVYGYCRWADDLGDETGGGERALALLQWWRQELLSCYDDRPRHPVMIALHQTIRRFAIPPQPFLNLLLAFEQDQRVKRYETYEQLLDYCRHSANPVGHLVLYLGRAYDQENALLADAICTGLQLANFWQDVARDSDIGRVYLPAEDCRRFGYSEADLQARRFTAAFAALMRFQVERARELFNLGWPLVKRVPSNLRTDIELFIGGGLGILSKVEACGFDVWQQRPVLSKWKKTALLGRALWGRLRRAIW